MSTVKDYDGKDLVEGKTKVTYRAVINAILNRAVQGEILTAEKQAKSFQITLKLFKDKEVDLTLDDRAFIKERLSNLNSPLLYGRISEILEEKK